ncbi:unnamed protein product [Peronospora belbahrii]|uniref:Uncharacterized protein n=1 Tax=Peronospora belbahrii TaxID=622444 RepID=A0ABN8D2Z6_9STRA|nr:unnamed protein product [Peronospora belbahrii]
MENLQSAKKQNRPVEEDEKQMNDQKNLVKETNRSVMLYIEELRGKLLAGANALFWLNVLQPMVHPAYLSRQEAREVLLLLLEELRNADGVCEVLMKKMSAFGIF